MFPNLLLLGLRLVEGGITFWKRLSASEKAAGNSKPIPPEETYLDLLPGVGKGEGDAGSRDHTPTP